MSKLLKPLKWVGSSLDDLKKFPDEAKRTIGFALDFAQRGTKHDKAKPLKGSKFKGASTLEIVEDYDGDTYRAVYTVKIKGAIHVLHYFQKKSKTGIRTPKIDIELINNRLKEVLTQEQ